MAVEAEVRERGWKVLCCWSDHGKKGPRAKEHEWPRAAGKGTEADSPLEPPEGMQAANPLIFVLSVRPILDFGPQNHKMINLQGFVRVAGGS